MSSRDLWGLDKTAKELQRGIVVPSPVDLEGLKRKGIGTHFTEDEDRAYDFADPVHGPWAPGNPDAIGLDPHERDAGGHPHPPYVGLVFSGDGGDDPNHVVPTVGENFHDCEDCGAASGEPCQKDCYGNQHYPGERDLYDEQETTFRPGAPFNVHTIEMSHSDGLDPEPYQDYSASPQNFHASTDGVRYAQVVEADVADDLMRLHTAADDDYRMRHRPPEPEDGAAMHDPSNVFPDIDTHPEWYSSAPGQGNPSWGPEERDYFRQQQQTDQESHAAIRNARGNPDHPVTIYRALPTSAQGADGSFPMNTGDWVTPSLAYARIHGDSNIGEPYSIIKHTAPAHSLFSEGNSIHEWGYNGAPARVHTASTDGVRYAHIVEADVAEDLMRLHTAAEGKREAFDPRDDHYFPGYHFGPASPGELDDDDATQADMETAWLIGEGSTRRKPHIQRGVEQGPAHPDAPLTDTERWLQGVGHDFATRIHQAEPSPDPFYRGMAVPPEWLDKISQDGSVTLPLSSFTPFGEMAYDYSRPDPGRGWSPRKGHPVILKVEPGSKSHPINDDENVSHGDFDVLGMHTMTDDELGGEYEADRQGHIPTTVVNVRQRSVPAPFTPPRTASTDGIRYAHLVEADVADDLMRLAGANGELPEGLTFQHHPEGFAEFPDVIQPTQNVSNAWPTVTAHDGDRMVGHLQWHGDHPRKKGEVWDIRVHPDYQRRGVGTAMFDWTTDQVEPDLHHSPNLSDEGRAFMEAEEARPLAQDRYEAWRNDQPMPKRFAAVNQDLVDRLHGEFHDWRKQQPKGSIFGGGIIGGLNEWPNIEKFLKDQYPAAHRNLNMGHEQAGLLMDGIHPNGIEGGDPYSTEYLPEASFEPYETGIDAETKHGYDPKEIAAAMLLLHNKTDRFRGDMSEEDQARLNDIAQKRFQMQRDYEQRTGAVKRPTNWPPGGGWHPRDEGDGMLTLYHRTSPENADEIIQGQRFLPGKKYYPNEPDKWQYPPDLDRTHFATSPEGRSSGGYDERGFAGRYGPAVVKVRVPTEKVYWPPGDFDYTPGADNHAYVYPEDLAGVPIIRHAMPKTAMPAPLPKGTYFRYHPELVWSPGVTAHAPGGKMVGSLEWYDDDHVMVDLGTRRPGEIDRIQVPEDHRGQSIATSMFDFAKQHEPRLHHSDQLTEDGRGWSQYEQSRHARLAEKNGDLPEGLTFQHHPDGFDPFPAFDPDDPVPPPGHKWVQFQEDFYDEDEDDNSVPFYLATLDGDSWHVRGADSGFRYPDDELKIHDQLPPGVKPDMDIDSWPTVSAHDGDRTAGYLQWINDEPNHNGEIRNIQVHPDYRRRGIGLALFDQASKVEPRLHHSENLTRDGEGFANGERSRHARLAGKNGPPPRPR